MRLYHLFFVVFAMGCAAQASTGEEACADIAVTELPPIDIASAPPVEINFPKRTIEVEIGGMLANGVLNTDDHCYEVVATDPYTVDYNDCCPSGWHVLAMGAGGLLCEEN